MKKCIPLHSLVITVSPAPVQHETYIRSVFENYEILTPESVRLELFGDAYRRDTDSTVFPEIHRRAETKLRLGERVVVHAANLRKDSRIALAKLGLNLGVPVFYLVIPEGAAGDEQAIKHFLSGEKDILRGDGLAEVIDIRDQKPDPVQRLPIYNRVLSPAGMEDLRRRFKGVTVVGDVHGMYQSLLSTIEWAKTRSQFIVFLGDIIDYGHGSLESADEVNRLIMRGGAELIIGNHERKIAKWIDQPEKGRHMMRLSEGNRVTTQALGALGDPARGRWMNRFRGMVARSHLSLRFGDIYMTHGAAHPSIWSKEPDYRAVETHALFGEVDLQASTGQDRPTRTYDWVDLIPTGITVLVGHDARSNTYKPLVETNAQGGRAVFMDTGSGKGGRLSSVDLRFTDTGLKLENFNTH